MGKHSPLKENAVGIRVRKQFFGTQDGKLQWFEGAVTKYTQARGYEVQYSDGDSEELKWQELKKFMLPRVGKCNEKPRCSSTDQAVAVSAPMTAANPQDLSISRKRGHPSNALAAASNKENHSPKPKRARQVKHPVQPTQDATAGHKADQTAADHAAAAACKRHSTTSETADVQKRPFKAQALPATTAKSDSDNSENEAAGGSESDSADTALAGAAPVTGNAAGDRPPPAPTGRVRMYATKTCTGLVLRHNTDAQKPEKKPSRKRAVDTAAGEEVSTGKKQSAPKQKRLSQKAKGSTADVSAAASLADAFPAAAVDESQQTGKQKQKQQRQQEKKKDTVNKARGPAAAADPAAAAAAAAAAGVDSSNEDDGSGEGVRQSRAQRAIYSFEPACVLAAAYAVAACDAVGSVSPDDVDGAAPVVTTADGVPLWEMKDEDAQVTPEDQHEYLARTATSFPAGKQPYKAFSKQQSDALEAAVAGKTAEQLAAAPAVAAAADAAAGRVLAVMDEPFADDGARLATAMKQAQDEFWRAYRLATVTEAERVARVLLEQSEQRAAGSTDKLKHPSARPDRVAESLMLNEEHKAVNDRDSFGHIPGVNVNNTFNLRSEMCVLGIHKSPLGGIVSATIPVPVVVNGKTYRGVRAATSICMSGCYEDDHDSTSAIITYTGEGGNDLLGNKKQVKGQELKRGNKALMANIALGIPVRLLRRNDEKKAAMNSVLFYDGLYDVVSWMKTLGKEGKVVFIFGLRRRPGQEQSLSKPIERFKAVGIAKKGRSELVRENLICRDISKGKENLPVVVHNEVDRELPPGIDPLADKQWICDDRANSAGPLIANKEPFTYITANVYVGGVPGPQPPQVVEEGSAAAAAALDAAAAAAAAAENEEDEAAGADASILEPSSSAVAAAAAAAGGSSSSRLRCRSSSSSVNWVASRGVVIQRVGETAHELLARLNGGNLPYESRLQKGQGEKGPVVPVVRALSRVLVECGDWTGCRDAGCQQRQVDKGLRHRLEVFKTPDKGWAVRCWDTIKSGSLVCVMVGMIVRAEDVGTGRKYNDSEYFFDCQPRQDVKWGAEIFKDDSRDVKHILCAKEQGGVARFINHSCHPNLYVQPVCSGHTDPDMVSIGLFADCNIPPFTELTYDYGSEYIEKQLCGVCLCGADCCKYKPHQQQQE